MEDSMSAALRFAPISRFVLVLVALALAGAGCANKSIPSDYTLTPSLDRPDATASASIEKGQTLVVRLPSYAKGSNWTIVSPSDNVVTSMGRKNEGEAYADVSEGAGATEWQTFRFRGERAGTSKVRFAYGRTWEQAETPRRLALEITVAP
jgi:predicted secreted protein